MLMPIIPPETLFLPDGNLLASSLTWTDADRRSSIILLVASGLSILAVLGMLAVITSSAFKSREAREPSSILSSPAICYFLSLLLCDILQAVGSFMSVKWLMEMKIESDALCTAQAVVKQTADVGIALWSMVIAFHTFYVFTSDLPARHFTVCGILISGWSATGAVVIAGPAIMQLDMHGPFYGIINGRCFITDSYNLQRGLLDYMIMIMSAICVFIVYAIISSRLHSTSRCRSLRAEKSPEVLHLKKLGRQMLLYPVAYGLLILPITIERSITWFGHSHVPLAATTFCEVIYLLSGVVHPILFVFTQHAFAYGDAVTQLVISKPQFLESSVSITPSRSEFSKRERASVDETFGSYDVSHIEANPYSDITGFHENSGSQAQAEKRAESLSSKSDAPNAEVLSDESIRRHVCSLDPAPMSPSARESDYYSHSAVDAQFEIVNDFFNVHIGADEGTTPPRPETRSDSESTLYSLPSMLPMSPMNHMIPDHGRLVQAEEQQNGSTKDTRQTAGSLLDYYSGR